MPSLFYFAGSAAIGLAQSLLFGWFVALIFGGFYNAFAARRSSG